LGLISLKQPPHLRPALSLKPEYCSFIRNDLKKGNSNPEVKKETHPLSNKTPVTGFSFLAISSF